MDFASLMSAQISKAKAVPLSLSTASEETPAAAAGAAGAGAVASSKYIKRADVEAAREAAYLAEQERAAAEREQRAATKRKRDEEEAEANRVREEKKRRLAEESRLRREEEDARIERARRKRLGLPLEGPGGGGVGNGADGPLGEGEAAALDEASLQRRLRELGEPVTLFGETEAARLKRYKSLTKAVVVKMSGGPIPTTLELVSEVEMQVPAVVPAKGTSARDLLFRQLASYFSMVLREWETALDRREPGVKESHAGRAAYNAMVQSRENMRPLFRKFEKADVEDGVLEPVVEIVRAAQERRYVDANDGYLRLSIGKAAWPIGVTMVGIHERSAREKLHESDKQAHIMSDELTRKYLQSIKRCLSFAQTRWPPDDQLQLMG